MLVASLLMGGLTISPSAHAQLWKRIKKEVKTRTENHIIRKAGDITDKTIDKTEETATDTADGNKRNQPMNGNKAASAPYDNSVGASSVDNTSDDLVTPDYKGATAFSRLQKAYRIYTRTIFTHILTKVISHANHATYTNNSGIFSRKGKFNTMARCQVQKV